MPETNAPTLAPTSCTFTLIVKSPCDHWPGSITVDFREISPELESELVRAGELSHAIDIKVADTPVIGPAPDTTS